MTNHLLLTGYDDNMADIGRLTSSLMLAYASRYRMDFRCIRNFDKAFHPAWQKARLILDGLSDGYASVLWLDADTVITNFALAPWRNCSSGLHVSQDWGSNVDTSGQFSTANMVSCQDTIPLWEEALKREKKWGNKDLWEQACLHELFNEFAWVREKITIHPRRDFNAVPAAASSALITASEPWQQGDWLCHLTGIHRETRIAIFYEILPSEYQLGLSKSDYEHHAAKRMPRHPISPLSNCLSD